MYRRILPFGLALTLVGALALARPHGDPSLIPELSEVSGRTDYVTQLSDDETAADALEAILAEDTATARELLTRVALDGEAKVSARGWAILGLSKLDGDEADVTLSQIHGDGSAPMLVRTWAAAGRVQRANTLDQVMALAPLANTFPGVDRPVRKRMEALIANGDMDGESMLRMVATNGQLQQALAPAILGLGGAELARLTYEGADQTVRWQAASYLAGLGTQSPANGKKVGADVIAALDYTGDTIPWEGGALYIPNIGWQQDNGQELVGQMIRWYIHCGRNGLQGEQQQISNNLYSVGLLYTAGFGGGIRMDEKGMLQDWLRVAGKAELRALLEDLDLSDEYKDLHR